MYIYVCTPCPHPLKPAQKIEKADLKSNLVERVYLRIKLESQDNLLKSFGLDQQYSNQIKFREWSLTCGYQMSFFEAV